MVPVSSSREEEVFAFPLMTISVFPVSTLIARSEIVAFNPLLDWMVLPSLLQKLIERSPSKSASSQRHFPPLPVTLRT